MGGEAGKSKYKVPADSVPGEGLFLACRWPPSFAVSLHGRGGMVGWGGVKGKRRETDSQTEKHSHSSPLSPPLLTKALIPL
jgi:hypothetical protein